MKNYNNSSKLEKQQRFWDAYREAAEENRVRTDLLVYYEKWVKTFIDFMPDKNLRERSGKDIETFLVDLAQRPNVADWQVRQARHALKILYEMFLPHYAPATTPASVSKMAGQDSEQGQGTITGRRRFRDQVLPGEVERRFSALVEALRTEVRTRHYSYRTETTYLDWVRRYITMLPERFAGLLPEHLGRVKAIYEQDLAKGTAEVYIWPALARKYPRAGKEWIWQCFEQAWPHGEEPSGFLIVLSNSPRQHIQPGSKKHPCHTTQTGVKKQELKNASSQFTTSHPCRSIAKNDDFRGQSRLAIYWSMIKI
jgi:hypothetical protein